MDKYFLCALNICIIPTKYFLSRTAVNSLSTQSMVFTGRSGAGKTSSFKKVLEYLVDTTQGDADTAVFTSK